ncbi:hypothetical protein ACFWNR_27720 [Streptomyces virginiae]|uniref:hypothetical protein n=1 Tax=Streptomyces virginiae TaxID=1961 RepID=UPI0036647077
MQFGPRGRVVAGEHREFGGVRDRTDQPRHLRRPGHRPVDMDAVVLVTLLATCAGTYLTVGEGGFASVISTVAALYGTWRARR